MSAQNWLPDEKELILRRRRRLLSILANENRLKILYYLQSINKKVNFNDIVHKLQIKNSKLAYHIGILKSNKLINNSIEVNDKQGKKFSFYSLSDEGLKALDLLDNIQS